MVDLLKWPRLWFGIFLRPEETAAALKKEKPRWIDGVISIGFCSFLIGLLLFIIFAILSIISMFALGGSFASNAAGVGMSIVILFMLLVIGFPLLMIIILLVSIAFLRIASLILKGKGSISEECGFLGSIGGSYMIIMFLMYAVLVLGIFVPSILFSGIIGAIGSMALMYLMMGVAYLVFMPLFYLVLAFTFDVLADIEQVTIYRSGAIVGLMIGLMCFVFMVVLVVFMLIFSVLFAGLMSGFGGGMYPPMY